MRTERDKLPYDCPYKAQLNGVSETMITTITEKDRSVVNCAELDRSYWGEDVLTATYLINMIPIRALGDSSKTLYEAWHSRKPNFKYLVQQCMPIRGYP